MRLNCTTILRAVCALILVIFSASCMDEFNAGTGVNGEIEVGFYAGGRQTRTSMHPNGLSAEWSDGDKVAVWARNSSGTYILNQEVFTTYAIDGSRSFFTSTLPSEMADDTYTYYCCYPVPNSVSGTTAKFYLTGYQDGKVSGGSDIMVATPVQHGPLAPIPEILDHSGLSMQMNRLLHQFRFWIPEDQDILPANPIERILLTFPTQVNGEVWVDLSNPSSGARLLSGYSEFDINLAEPISADKQNYACVAFVPTKFNDGDKLEIMAYTADKIVLFDPVDLCAKDCKAGHSTPVKLKIKQLTDIGRFRFTVSENNLGENPTSVTLTAPEGCSWGDSESNVYTYTKSGGFSAGETFEIVFEDIYKYRALGGKNITVSFDSEHVTTSETVTLPDLTKVSSYEVACAVPYLLYEDFSTVPSFSSNDKYGTSSAGSMGYYSFLNGWTGGRIGASAGKCIRIACRRETSARYGARVDSKPIIALKKSADIDVTFDYGMNNEFLKGLISNPDVGQTFYVGYVTSTSGYKSGDETGTYGAGTYMHDKTGSYDSTPYNDTFTIEDVPTGVVRISWRTVIEHNSGLTNTTCWLYIDNVKVQIANSNN